MSERMKPTDVLKDPGFRRLTPDEEKAVSLAYRHDLLAGLQGKPSDLPMFPSLLSPVDLTTLKEGKQALVIEIGGTNVYATRIFPHGGKVKIEGSVQEAMGQTTFENVDDFFSVISSKLDPMLQGGAPDTIGIIYSFPGNIIQTNNGIDVMSPEVLTKELVIPGISENPVGESLLAFLSKTYGFLKSTPIVVSNDTVGVAMSDGAKIGGVVASGFNLAVTTTDGLVNTESGGFNKIPTHQLVEKIDEESVNRGKYFSEKQIAGTYLGKQFALATERHDLDATEISRVLNDGKADGEYKVAKILRDRSTQLVGIMIGTAIKTFPDVFTERLVNVPIEGSLFWRMPQYVERTQATAERISGSEINFVNIPYAGRVGAGVAALSFIK